MSDGHVQTESVRETSHDIQPTAMNMIYAADAAVWSCDESSLLFRQHVEHEVLSCQSGQQSIVDLVRMLSSPKPQVQFCAPILTLQVPRLVFCCLSRSDVLQVHSIMYSFTCRSRSWLGC